MSQLTEEVPETVSIIPDWVQMVRYFGYNFAQQAWRKNSYSPVAAFIEMVAYLQTTKPEAVKELIEEFSAKAKQNKE